MHKTQSGTSGESRRRERLRYEKCIGRRDAGGGITKIGALEKKLSSWGCFLRMSIARGVEIFFLVRRTSSNAISTKILLYRSDSNKIHARQDDGRKVGSTNLLGNLSGNGSRKEQNREVSRIYRIFIVLLSLYLNNFLLNSDMILLSAAHDYMNFIKRVLPIP